MTPVLFLTENRSLSKSAPSQQFRTLATITVTATVDDPGGQGYIACKLLPLPRCAKPISYKGGTRLDLYSLQSLPDLKQQIDLMADIANSYTTPHPLTIHLEP
jgi:hypothetical protein